VNYCCSFNQYLEYRETVIHQISFARGSVMVKAVCYKPEGHRFETRWGKLFFSIYLILPSALDPGVYSASNRNEYQKQKTNVSGGWSVAGEQDWQPCCHLWADCLDNTGSLTSHNHIGLQGLLWGRLYFFFLNKCPKWSSENHHAVNQDVINVIW
jgi:hypothetical protein